jgi:hypothetical protein
MAARDVPVSGLHSASFVLVQFDAETSTARQQLPSCRTRYCRHGNLTQRLFIDATYVTASAVTEQKSDILLQ